MRKRFVFVAVIMFLFLLMPALLFFTDEDGRTVSSLDAVEVNELISVLSKNFDDISKVKDMKDTSFDYEVMDNDGKILMSTSEGMAGNIGRATSDRYTIRDIEKDGKVLGKLLIRNDYDSVVAEAYDGVMNRYIIFAVIECAVVILFLLWIYINVVRPFEKMKRFATDISSGNLDAPLRMDRGNLFGVFTESFDIMRSELNSARQREYEAQRSKAELVAQLSHDIKTPVASIKTMGELLDAKSNDYHQSEKLHLIVKKADQIDLLISDLFAATLEDLDNLEVDASEQPSTILADVIREADYEEHISAAEIADCLIICDPVRICQVVNNIVSNSYKYADTEIFLKSYTEDGFLAVTFTDRGGGVPEEELPMLTKRFRRGSNTRDIQGAGLGLAIAKELMEKMDGFLELSNCDGGFRVKLLFKLA